MSGQGWVGGRGGHNWKKQVCLKMLFRQFQVFLAHVFFSYWKIDHRWPHPLCWNFPIFFFWNLPLVATSFSLVHAVIGRPHKCFQGKFIPNVHILSFYLTTFLIHLCTLTAICLPTLQLFYYPIILVNFSFITVLNQTILFLPSSAQALTPA